MGQTLDGRGKTKKEKMGNDYNEVFAKYYDLINSLKDYAHEAKAILSAIREYYSGTGKTLADVGCGTGNFTILFKENGFEACGYDISREMISVARSKYPSIDFFDESFENNNNKFDIITSLFNVTNSLGDYDRLCSFFDSIAKSMKENSIFIFDTWNGSEVFREVPKVKSKVIEKDETKVVRTVVPVTNIFEQTSFHTYEIKIYQNGILRENVKTTLHNYFYTYQEIKRALNDSGLDVISTFPNKEFGREVENDFIINFVCKLK